MSSDDEEVEEGCFTQVLALAGLISGGIFGYNHGDLLGMLIGAIVLCIAGYWIGKVADAIVKLIALVVLILINGVIRSAIWQAILWLLDQL
jgi:membrane protein DedA with SNARE-associated domain